MLLNALHSHIWAEKPSKKHKLTTRLPFLFNELKAVLIYVETQTEAKMIDPLFFFTVYSLDRRKMHACNVKHWFPTCSACDPLKTSNACL